MKIIYLQETIHTLFSITEDQNSIQSLVDSGEIKETESGIKYLLITQ